MLDELRRKPRSVRNRYAFIVAFLMTGAIAGVWFLSLGVNGINEQTTDSGPVKQSEEDFFSSISNLTNQAFERVSNIFSSSTSTDIGTQATSTESAVEPSAVDKVITDTFKELNNKQSGQKKIQIATSSDGVSE